MPAPTLFIGIGGTGTRMLADIERELGPLAGRPIGLLALDARTEPEVPLGKGIFKRAPAAINFVETWHAVRDNIAEWAPDGLAPKADVDFEDGCGMTRGFGRFFSVYNADFLIERIAAGIQQVVSNAPKTTPVNALDVFLMSSLTNGTGAGLLLDVAAYVRHVAAATHKLANLRIIGVHLDALAIEGASVGVALSTESRRRAANSLASVLELDSWFRNSDPDRTWNVNIRGDRKIWHTVDLGPGRKPLDYALIVQSTNRSGHHLDREPAAQAAAHALALWVSGVDPGQRKLDAFVGTTDPNCFGSIGAAILRVPDSQLSDWIELVALEEALAFAAGHESKEHLDTLTVADPTYKHLAPTVVAAVQHFLKEVLRIEERPGLNVNQIFDRFAPERLDLCGELEQIHDSLDRTEDAAAIPGIVDELDEFIDKLEGLPDQWKQKARLAAKDEIIPAIDAYVQALVERGAVGLARRVLLTMRDEVKAAWADVLKVEGLKVTEGDRSIEAAFNAERDLIRRRADHLMSWLKLWFKSAVRASIETIKDLTVQELNDWFWAAGVDAATELFGEVKTALDKQIEVLEVLEAKLVNDQARGQTSQSRAATEKALSEVAGGGVVAVGTDLAFRTHLLAGLRAQGKLDAHKMAARGGRALIDAHIALREAQKRPLDWADRTSAVSLLKDASALTSAMRKAISAELRNDVNQECSLGKVLRTSATLAMNDWITSVRQSRDTATQDAGRARLEGQYSDELQRAIAALDWDSDPNGALTEAMDLLVAHPFALGVAAAVPMWVMGQTQLARLIFLAVHPDNRAAAKAHLDSTSAKRVFCDADSGVSRSEALILQLELGASLDDLHLPDGYDIAYRAHLGHAHFHPHTDRRYGRSWPLAGKWNLGVERRAAALLALAVELGVLKKTPSGSFKALVDLRGGAGNTLALATGALIPVKRGHLSVIAYLSGAEGLAVRAALSSAVRQSAQARLHAAGGPKPLADWIDGLEGAAATAGGACSNESLKEAWAHTQVGLAEVANALRSHFEIPDWL